MTTKLSMNCEARVEPVALSQSSLSPVRFLIWWKISTSAICPIRKAVIEPAMIHIPWPKILSKATFILIFCPSTTWLTQKSEGTSPMVKPTTRNAYEIRTAARMDKNLTCLIPKYSLIISVIINMSGQVTTPADILKDRFSTPNILISNLGIPNDPSTVNIFTPINSARIALATKKDPRTSKSRLSLVLKLMEGFLTNIYFENNNLIRNALKKFKSALLNI